MGRQDVVPFGMVEHRQNGGHTRRVNVEVRNTGGDIGQVRDNTEHHVRM